jgi:predicted transcriptional regulator of viral defense system
MAISATKAILKRIRAKHRGSVFTPREFAHLGTRAAVDQALSRLQRSGQIRRLSRGIYEFPKIHPQIGVLSPSPKAVANAMAERTGSRITISGAKAANLLGLSTQVPMQNVFWTEGPSRTIRIGNQTIMLKHVAPSKMIGAGTEAGIVIQAVRPLGKTESAHGASLVRCCCDEYDEAMTKHLMQAPDSSISKLRLLAEYARPVTNRSAVVFSAVNVLADLYFAFSEDKGHQGHL